MRTPPTGSFARNTPEQAPAHSLLDVELRKWDEDFRFLVDCFQTALRRIGEGDLAEFVADVFSNAPVAGTIPPRGSQALSMASQLLTMAEENTANQVRRMRETISGAASEPGVFMSEAVMVRIHNTSRKLSSCSN